MISESTTFVMNLNVSQIKHFQGHSGTEALNELAVVQCTGYSGSERLNGLVIDNGSTD